MERGNDRLGVGPRRDRDGADDEDHADHAEQHPPAEERRERRWLAASARWIRARARALGDVRVFTGRHARSLERRRRSERDGPRSHPLAMYNGGQP
jgi:hypothetical protein